MATYIYRTMGAFLMLKIFFSFCRTDPFIPNLPLLASQHQNTTTHTKKLKMNHAPIAANHMTETMLLFRHHWNTGLACQRHLSTFFNNNNTHPMVNIQNSFYTQTHKIQLKLKQANRKTNPKTPCHKKQNWRTCGFCTLKLFIFKLCSHIKIKKKKKEHYISLHKPCWREEEEGKKGKKIDA